MTDCRPEDSHLSSVRRPSKMVTNIHGVSDGTRRSSLVIKTQTVRVFCGRVKRAPIPWEQFPRSHAPRCYCSVRGSEIWIRFPVWQLYYSIHPPQANNQGKLLFGLGTIGQRKWKIRVSPSKQALSTLSFSLHIPLPFLSYDKAKYGAMTCLGVLYRVIESSFSLIVFHSLALSFSVVSLFTLSFQTPDCSFY